MRRNILLRIILILFFSFFVSALMSGCKTVYVPVEKVKTEYKDRLLRDSIYLKDSVYVRDKGDTVFIDRWHTAYRDRLKVDSIVIRDSIPVPYPVEVIKTVEKKMSWWQRIKMNTGGFTLCALFILFLYYTLKIVRKLKAKG